MAQFYFHLIDGNETIPDHEGRDLSDLAAAKAVALIEARAMISADAVGGRISLTPRIAIVDAKGATLGMLAFSEAVEIVPADPR